MKEKIEKIIYKIVPDGESLNISHDTELMKSGIIDSFTFVELVEAIESAFSVRVPADELVFENFETVEVIESFISKLQA